MKLHRLYIQENKNTCIASLKLALSVKVVPCSVTNNGVLSNDQVYFRRNRVEEYCMENVCAMTLSEFWTFH
jgi:hypothetical protein